MRQVLLCIGHRNPVLGRLAHGLAFGHPEAADRRRAVLILLDAEDVVARLEDATILQL